MVFLNKPHPKIYTDILDTTIRNNHIFRVYLYFYALSLFYLILNNNIDNNVFKNKSFIFLNIILSSLCFKIVINNLYKYPLNCICNIIFSITTSNITYGLMHITLSGNIVHMISITSNITFLSILTYTYIYFYKDFRSNQCSKLVFYSNIVSLIIFKYFNMINIYNVPLILIFMFMNVTLQINNIKIIIKRYMHNEFYLSYLNLYLIIIDIIDKIF